MASLIFYERGPIDNQRKGGGFDLGCDLRDEMWKNFTA
jgi:hypothetical protein